MARILMTRNVPKQQGVQWQTDNKIWLEQANCTRDFHEQF